MMEPEDVARFGREIDAMGRKADDVEGFAQLVTLLTQMRTTCHDAAIRLNMDDSISWAEIARGLGVARQSAWERFKKPPTTPGNLTTLPGSLGAQ